MTRTTPSRLPACVCRYDGLGRVETAIAAAHNLVAIDTDGAVEPQNVEEALVRIDR
jgi:hypothetical protein